MIKTIKVKRELNLSELIAYISGSGKKGATFVSNYENMVRVDLSGQITTKGKFYNDIFIAEVEEEIDNTMIFKSVVGVLNNDEIRLTNLHTTIEDIQNKYGSMKEIHAVIDGKLQLIYERNEESINA